jgi:hypothetical protein
MADHVRLEGIFKEFVGNFSITQSQSQQENAYILSKTSKVSTSEYGKQITTDYWKYLNAITKKANEKPIPPYGAYIGGMSTINKLFIIGPSNLDQYEPIYRSSDGQVKQSFEKAKEATNLALSCLKDINSTNKPSGINIDLSSLNDMIPAEKKLQERYLFRSYHGMIQAIVKYQSTNDTSKFYFEIALGNNTSKVSSCLPCSIFMNANETSATSTHFGRGDNWSIPSSCSKQLTEAWAKNIKDYYDEGSNSINTLPKHPVSIPIFDASEMRSRLDKLTSWLGSRPGPLHAIFLEALTFESAFQTKIFYLFPEKSKR